MSEQSQHAANPEIKVHVSQDLDYTYRDIANIFVGSGEVTFEFGNYHKSMPGHATISNRIVMSISNVYDLQKRLQIALSEAQQRMENDLRKRECE
jgi:hypothetical protein